MPRKRHNMLSATSDQIQLARENGIPLHLAYTIDKGKYEAYQQYLNTPEVKLECWFDRQEEWRMTTRNENHQRHAAVASAIIVIEKMY